MLGTTPSQTVKSVVPSLQPWVPSPPPSIIQRGCRWVLTRWGEGLFQQTKEYPQEGCQPPLADQGWVFLAGYLPVALRFTAVCLTCLASSSRDGLLNKSWLRFVSLLQLCKLASHFTSLRPISEMGMTSPTRPLYPLPLPPAPSKCQAPGRLSINSY